MPPGSFLKHALQTPPPSEKSDRYTTPLPDDDNCDAEVQSSWWGPSAMLVDAPTSGIADVEIYRRVRHGLLLHPGGMHIYIMPTHFESAICKEISELREKVSLSGGMFAKDIFHSKVVLTKVWREKRARLDLRTCGVYTETLESEDECFWKVKIGPETISVVNVEWLEDSWRSGHILSMDEYVVHHGRVLRYENSTLKIAEPI